MHSSIFLQMIILFNELSIEYLINIKFNKWLKNGKKNCDKRMIVLLKIVSHIKKRN